MIQPREDMEGSISIIRFYGVQRKYLSFVTD
jgi:hypothetical protein